MDVISTFFYNYIWCPPFLGSLIANLATSFIFLFALLFLFRPTIRISPHIATISREEANGIPGGRIYVFKIVNKSFFRAFDLKLEVSQKMSIQAPEGKKNKRTIPLNLVKASYNHIPPYWYIGETDYAIQFITTDDVRNILSTNQHAHIELIVICKHGLTGLGSVFVKNYSVHDIQEGTFKSGNTFKMV
ncbi:hypothetical protein [Dyadobacter sandarakinus]|uniref:Uncharacterized protein n=1 Tax=Dyadobacter sandarakinus TaxID=2747268 RepID=A0ABX7I1T0_9BACT|nr:hypothetical protein [Dyadobacter sandarakinus]QRQ99758.1 hypothetical protein HWI92_01900 [Dyadobacter sandarakinus]